MEIGRRCEASPPQAANMIDMRGNTSAACNELLIIDPKARYDAFLEALRSARRSIELSVFRCDHPAVVTALVDAERRGVRVRALLTNRARGAKKQLADLYRTLQHHGIQAVRYGGPYEKYHPKYAIVDGKLGVIGSMNLTRDHFCDTDDFLVMSLDTDLVSAFHALFETDWHGAAAPTPACSPRLVVSPDNARKRLSTLIRQAERSIAIVDHKLEDPHMLSLLNGARRRGVNVELFDDRVRLGLRAHGKAVVIDELLAVVGSLALTADTLDFRRDLAVVIEAPSLMKQLLDHLDAIRRWEFVAVERAVA